MVNRLEEITRVLRLEGQAILDCAERFRAGETAVQMETALDLLGRALASGGKIVVTGIGKSGKVAQKIAATLSSTGCHAIYLHPTEGLHGDLGIVQPRDAVLALSHTGNTDELLQLIPSLRRLDVSVIAITGNPRSRLVQLCDAWIDGSIQQEACPHNLAPTTSTTLALALGDAIAVALMLMRGFDAEAFARNHPGGAIGRRLSLRVSDVMHRWQDVAQVPPDAPMDEVVVAATRKQLGAVVVAQGRKLLGLITEGDIRRALSHRERFFALKASAVMTPEPITARPTMMAREALELMENRPNQINVLPVIDDGGEWLGLVRVHDLVRAL